jgi:FMN phosphatase YigB (HAD superfamily)
VPIRAVSFDFHDTVALCPTWFQLEVRHLVSATHARLVADGHLPPGPEAADLDAAYRRLRLTIHEHGNERDAATCVHQVLAEFGQRASPEAVAATIEHLQRDALADLRPRPGVVAGIRRLAAAGLPVGITSNAVYHPFLGWSLDAFGLTASLRSVITSASCGYYKSRPEIYHRTAAALGVPLGDLVHIGDSFRFDVVPANGLGARTVWLNLTGGPPPQPGLADLIVEDLEQIADRVLALA